MTQAIHVDRFNLCRAGITLNLDENGHGPHGQAMCRPFKCPYGQPFSGEDVQPFTEALIEHVFELVRQAEFPERFSRFACWYGAESMEWANHDAFKGYPVWLIEAEQSFRADAQLLDVFSTGSDGFRYFNPDMALQNARYYWQGKTLAELLRDTGEITDSSRLPSPSWELLLAPPVRVVKPIRV